MTKIPMKKAVEVIIGYLAGEVSKVPNLKDRFMLFAGLGAAKANPDAVIGGLSGTLKTIGVVDSENNVCLDSVRSAMEMAFANVPNFNFMNFTFTSADAEEVMRRLEA